MGGGGWVVVVVIVWKLDLQLHMQLVSITTNVVSSNPAPGEEYSLQHNMMFSPGTSVFSTSKTDSHDIT